MSNNYKSKIYSLVQAMEGDKIMLDAVEMQVNYFTGYVNSVIDYVIKGEIVRHSGASYDQVRAELEKLDVNRKIAHDGAISAVTTINRLCDMYGVEHLPDVDTSDRYAVANFVGNFVLEVYKGEINGKGMDQAVEDAKGRHYDTIRMR